MSDIEPGTTFRVVDTTSYKVELGNILMPPDTGVPDRLHITHVDGGDGAGEEQWTDIGRTRNRSLHLTAVEKLLANGDIERIGNDTVDSSDSISDGTVAAGTPDADPAVAGDHTGAAEETTDDQMTPSMFSTTLDDTTTGERAAESDDAPPTTEDTVEDGHDAEFIDTTVPDTEGDSTPSKSGLVPDVEPESSADGDQILTAGETTTETAAEPDDERHELTHQDSGLATDAKFIDADTTETDTADDTTPERADTSAEDATDAADDADETASTSESDIVIGS